MLTSKQRAQLRSTANSYEVIVHIGKGGINEAMIKQADDALEKRELIKCGLLETSPVSVREAADSMALAVNADVVQVIGRKFILYRESKDNSRFIL